MNDTIALALLLAIALLVLACVAQTIRLELAREQIHERDAQLARREVLSTPRCKSLAQCVAMHDRVEKAERREDAA